MTNAETLLSLAERVEAASGADRELDGAIHIVLYGEPGDKIDWSFAALVSPYTASLDAAMSLVPEGYDLTIDRRQGYSEAAVYADWNMRADGQAKATTPALALLAAALRAHAPQSQEPSK